jgi:ribosomal protein S18 acetylase RimI-like enzyme
MNLRPAHEDDAAAVAALSTQLGYPAVPEETAERLRSLAGHPDHAVLVAEDDTGDTPDPHAVVAWIHIRGSHFVESAPFAEIAGLVVDERHRGKKIGESLVEAAAAWARERGYATLRVRSNIIRERAHAFYERQGFERIKTQVVFSRTL